MTGAPEPPSPSGPPPAGPGPVTAVLAVLVTAVGVVAASLLTERCHAGPALRILAAQSVPALVAAAAMFLGWWSPTGCGMAAARPRHLLGGLALGPALAVGGAMMGLIANLLLARLVGPPPEAVQKVDEILRGLRLEYGFAAMAAIACVLPGVVEEMLMRGLVLTGLRRRCSGGAAVVLAAIAFAALHLSPWRFLPQLWLGLVLGWLALRTGSCWPGAAAHAGYNLVVLVVFASGPITLQRQAALALAVPVGLLLAWTCLRRPPTRA